MKIRWLVTILIPVLFGCQTVRKLTHIDCARLDWYELGRTDGGLGLPNSRAKNEAQCLAPLSEAHILQYDNGFQAGLTEYCSTTRGFEDGKSGRTNDSVCPWPLKERYVAGHRIGYKIYALHTENQEMDRKINELIRSNGYMSDLTRQLEPMREKKRANSAEIVRLENQMTSSLL